MGNKVLFVHDGPMYRDDHGNYFGVHFDDSLRRRFLNLGDEVTFLIRRKDLSGNAKMRLNLIKPEKCNIVPIPDFKSIRLYIKNYSRASTIIKRQIDDTDILVARLPSAAGLIAVKYARKVNKPYIVEMVGCTFDAYWNYGWKGKLIAHYKLKQFQNVLLKAPYVVYVTNEFLQKRYPTQGKSIACSNVELVNNHQMDVPPVSTAFPQKTESLKLCTIAAIDVPYKGQDDVIKAINLLRKRGVHVEYSIIGRGSPAYLQGLIDNHGLHECVKILGSVPHEEIFEILRTMDIYVQPSKQEGLPRALIEAMSVGLPAIGAKTAGIPELLDPAFIFEAGKPDQIANLIENTPIEDWRLQSKTNFERAKQYERSILYARRIDFYNLFLKENQMSAPVR